MNQLMQHIDALVGNDQVAVVATAAIILVVTAVCARLVSKFLRKVLNLGDDIPSSSIFVNIGRAGVWILGVCIMLATCFHVDVSAAITALGVGGIAISLGFQDTISNLIGGLQVSLMRIVTPGDNIEVGSSSGVVKDVTWRHTTICNSAGEEVIIPNSIIGKTALTHLPPTNRVSLPIVVATDGERLDEVARAIEQKAAEAAGAVAELTQEPVLSFSAIGNAGFEGTLVFQVADSGLGGKAGDAALRAIAPLTRTNAADRIADEALERARQREGEEDGAEPARTPNRASKPKPKSSRHGLPAGFRSRMTRALRMRGGGGSQGGHA